MIKVVCDRCGKKIADVYCRIKFEPASLVHTEQSVLRGSAAWGSTSNLVAKPILEELNSTPLYCTECVERIKRFIANGGPNNE